MKLNKFGYVKIESEEDYNKEFRKWNKRFKAISFKDLYRRPDYYITEINSLLNEGYERELISFEFKEKKLKQLNNEISSATNFKGDMVEKKRMLKDKVKQYFKR
jgi:hypothetical protein